jgi:hypothetical protein
VVVIGLYFGAVAVLVAVVQTVRLERLREEMRKRGGLGAALFSGVLEGVREARRGE